jgi:hypothetical protein
MLLSVIWITDSSWLKEPDDTSKIESGKKVSFQGRQSSESQWAVAAPVDPIFKAIDPCAVSDPEVATAVTVKEWELLSVALTKYWDPL